MEKHLITKDECYVQETCKKYKNNTCTESFCVRLYKIDSLYEKSLLTQKQRLPIALFADKDKEAFNKLSEYQSNILDFVHEGKNLYIYSNCTGNGKTSWAVKLMQAYIHKIWASSDISCRALFISIPKYTRELKLNISHKSDYIDYINRNISNADLVIWDDIAIKSTSEYEHEQLIAMIDSRLQSDKSNIFTTNITPENLSDCIGPRLTSRILGNSDLICFTDGDKRRIKP